MARIRGHTNKENEARGYSSLPSFYRERLEDSPRCAQKAANLDFEARIPVPFSVFPSTYKESETQTQTQTQTVTTTHEELEIKLPEKPHKPGREGHVSSFPQEQLPPPRKDHRVTEEVRIEEHYHRPGPGPKVESHTYVEEFRPVHQHFHNTTNEFNNDTRVQVDHRHHEHLVNPIDRIERQYRQRAQPSYYREEVTIEQRPLALPAHSHHSGSSQVSGHSHKSDHSSSHHSHHSHHHHSDHHSHLSSHFPSHHHHHHRPAASHVDEYTVDSERPRPQEFKETIKVTEETIEPSHVSAPQHKSDKMGYYDEQGSSTGYEIAEIRGASRPSSPGNTGAPLLPNTVTIPCHHIRLGDFLILQGRPCQVIKISTSAATGQYRYLGVDLFTKQLHEESSFIAHPSPSVVVQTMLGPIFKQYRVLDLSDGHVTAMTETGDVKPNLPVIDQSNLWSRLNSAFESGRGSVRVLVLNDAGRELAVDVKVIHGSRL
ncbi:Woronin body major protein [Colletotrichum fructicola]|uniref:Woronin body major protein n=1 Tax=Colletotrichum fructicola (strain Nara gc5) TaxID=1213859 RepID=L2G2R7_COLFN|nr:Woronin body major protein [Colletotrichum fructicola Nara gc5]KAF4901161.1 Woronin body major protein [Colletotrichum fructicola]KAF4911486.1 Woronin body major protein [Colletotrichum fructicola]KAF4939258.1 Woronin body major protein [Colletotrichum fructicola]